MRKQRFHRPEDHLAPQAHPRTTTTTAQRRRQGGGLSIQIPPPSGSSCPICNSELQVETNNPYYRGLCHHCRRQFGFTDSAPPIIDPNQPFTPVSPHVPSHQPSPICISCSNPIQKDSPTPFLCKTCHQRSQQAKNQILLHPAARRTSQQTETTTTPSASSSDQPSPICISCSNPIQKDSPTPFLCKTCHQRSQKVKNQILLHPARRTSQQTETTTTPPASSSDQTTFSCPLGGCGKTYRKKAYLYEHYRKTHPDSRRCNLGSCAEALFSSPHQFQKHIKQTHPNALPCRPCGKHFLTKKAQRTHLVKTHGFRPCTVRGCWDIFPNDQQRQNHMGTVHTHPMPCAYCTGTFTNRTIGDHIREFHGGGRKDT